MQDYENEPTKIGIQRFNRKPEVRQEQAEALNCGELWSFRTK